MPIEITIPRLGWSMDEAHFKGWLKKDGEQIKSGDALFTLESEKAAQDIEAADDGILQLQPDSPNIGDVVKVGQVIGLLLAEAHQANDESTSAPPAAVTGSDGQARGVHAASTPPNPEPLLMLDATSLRTVKRAEARAPQRMDRHFQSQAPPAAKAEGDAEIRSVVESEVASELVSAEKQTAAKPSPAISPRARRRAAELGVDATRLRGSGRTGRIIEADVLKAAVPQRPVGKATPIIPSQTSIMRRNIAERTALSFAKIPHFYLRTELDATELVELRQHLLGGVESEWGVRLTVTDFLLRAQALALRDFPAANSVWQENNIVRYADADIGLVVGLPDGLLIPIIRGAHNLSLVQLAQERTRLIGAARAGRCTAEMLAGGATSLSNLGSTRIDEFAAIIAPHQSSMLAVGRAAPRPYVVDGRLEIRTTLRLCLSVDHRVLDGGPAAEFLGRVVDLLASPKALIDDGASL